MNHSLTTTTTTNQQQQQTHQDGQQQQQQLPLKANQHRMNCNNQLRTNQLQIQHHPTTTVDRIQLPNNHSSNSLKESIKLTNETRNTTKKKKKKQKNTKIDLESFPQETLLKNLASLFDRITSRNDHLNNHTRRRPATPSSELGRKPQELSRRRRRRRPGTEEASTHQEDSLKNSYHNHLRREPDDNDEDCEEEEDDDETEEEDEDEDEDEVGRSLSTRPTQSPTVIHFQKLNQQNTRSPYSSPLAQPSCSSNTHHSSSNKEQQLSTASLELLSKPNSILTFHAKIVPQISIEAYLLRILKYCPTSNGVFLSTLIYLDRLCTFYHYHSPSLSSSSQTTTTTSSSSIMSTTTTTTTTPTSSSSSSSSPNNFNEIAKKKKKTNKWNLSPNHLTQFNFHFVIDSWNVHRFLIASITAASKLLSDVFYTNSRYAKVGGLPLEELEELEIKFLLMSDFRLMISASEFEDYTERLLGSSSSFTATSRCKHPSTSTPNTATTPTRRRKTTTEVAEDDDEEAEEGMDSEGSDSDSDTDTEQDRLRSGHLNAILTPHSDLIHHNSSSASSVSSCNSSERSSCSTITPHSPPPPQTPTHPPKTPPVPVPTTPRSAFASSSSSSASPSIS